MATTYLIRLEPIQFDELDCSNTLVANGAIKLEETIQFQDSNAQFLKAINAANGEIINPASINLQFANQTCSLSNGMFNYDTNTNTMQIVQLETPIEFKHSIELSDSSSNAASEKNSNSSAISVCEKIKVHQRKLNKYVRIRFREEFGSGFLLTHDLHECDQEKFERLRKECLTLFKPPGVSERTAWARAKQSLRLMRNAMLKS